MNTKYTIVALAISLLSMTAVSTAHADVITFDDAASADGNTPLANSFHGFSWDNFYALDTSNSAYAYSGYVPGTASGNNVAFNGYGDDASFSSGSTFILNSFFLTAVWIDDLEVRVRGFNGNTELYDRTLNPLADAKTLVELNWVGINKVTFETNGSHSFPGYGTVNSPGNLVPSPIQNFALDDITYNVAVVPEPESYAMLLAGLGALGFVGRRRRRQG